MISTRKIQKSGTFWQSGRGRVFCGDYSSFAHVISGTFFDSILKSRGSFLALPWTPYFPKNSFFENTENFLGFLHYFLWAFPIIFILDYFLGLAHYDEILMQKILAKYQLWPPNFNFAARSHLWEIGKVKADMLPKSSALESRHNAPNPKKNPKWDFWKSPKEIVKKSQGIFSIFKKSNFRGIRGPGQSRKMSYRIMACFCGKQVARRKKVAKFASF